MKKALLLLIDNPLSRLLTLAVLAVSGLSGRLASQLRFFALVKDAKRTARCHWSTEIKYPGNLTVGDHVTIGPRGVLGARSPIRIGNHARIARGVVIETGGGDLDVPPPFPHASSPITIGEGVCIFANAVVLGGVTIGEYSIIGAGCVVNKDVPPFTVVAPARRQQVPRAPSVRKRLAGGA
jgi:acetyltransferase-like isoleucine patch superfamily enzyme